MKIFLLGLLFLAFGAVAASAQTVAPLETAARQAFLLDVNTGTELFAKDADKPMPTSSMSKMMTIYMVFEALKDGKLTLDQTLPTSEHAWKQEGSRMFLNLGQAARVEDLIRGVVIQSGNDAAVVFAEALGGSEQNFADMMNSKAQEIGMKSSHFMNATGLPDPQHYSTARDLATLGMALLHNFPDRYHYFSELEFSYNGIKQGNRNPLLYRAMNVDGLKTGHTDTGGYGLTASALRNGRRLVLVLNGMDDMQARADESAKVLDWGYREFGLYPLAATGQKLAEAKVWMGTKPSVSVVAGEDIALTLPRTARAGLKAEITFKQPIQAPISKGQQVGVLTLNVPGIEKRDIPLVAANDVHEVGMFKKIAAKLRYLLHKDNG